MAERYFRKQDARSEQVFEALARFLEKFAEIVNQGGETAGLAVKGHLATMRVTPEG